MKTKIKIFLGGCLFLLTSMFLGAAGLHFSGTGGDKVTANVMDVVNVNTNTGTLLVLETDQISSAYAAGERLFLTGAGIMLTSEQYGDFYHNGGLKLYVSPVKNSNCNSSESVSYYFTGTTSLVSPFWGTVNIVSGTSYYCPQSQKFAFDLTGNTLGTIYAANTTSVANELFVFNSRKVMISGATNSKDIASTSSEYVSLSGAIEQQNNFVKVNASYEGSMLEINTTINKNLLAMTKGKTPLNSTSLITTSLNNSFNYYDYRGTTSSLPNSNLGNDGTILTLGEFGTGPQDTSKKISVTGENTLIVQGGNLYITNDIYNTDKNSILTIIVKRDEGNRRKNGGNVYIHPNVTNIDAVIIAEGSILNYNGTSVLTKSTAASSLRKQLLIYGAINTKNTLWDAVNSSIGTDHYENGLTGSGEIYSLGNLRTFQPMWNSAIPSGNSCYSFMKNVTAMNTNTTAEQYAFAGKRTCFRDGAGLGSLRTTEKLAPIVIEYNPLLQSKPPRILQNTY